MKASARILITAATLATLTMTMLGLAATATASVPTPPGGQQHPTTVEPGTGPQPGHGAQLHHDAHDAASATASQPATDPTTNADSAFAPWIAVLAVTVVGLLVGLAGAIWLGRRHRRPAAV
jgi:ABC-type transport system substrate-binding protein